jgi:hypothetical protein
MLIKELDQLKHENGNVEGEQVKVIEFVAVTERDVGDASRELADLRNQCSHHDADNLNCRKEIEHQEALVAEQKDVQHCQYNELCRLRDISFNLDKDLEAQRKRIDILRSEADNNEQRIMSCDDLLRQKEDATARC